MDNFMDVLLQIVTELGKQKLPDLGCLDVERIAFECRWYFSTNGRLPKFVGIDTLKSITNLKSLHPKGIWILLTIGIYVIVE